MGITMSPQSTKRRKTTDQGEATAMAAAGEGPSVISWLEGKMGITMSRQSTKRRKTTDQAEATATAIAGEGPPVISRLEGEMGITVSRQSTKRRKTTNHGEATATATAGVPAIDSLLPELLDTIFGLLDVRTLCTARLVCTHFHGAASRCFRSVEISVDELLSRPDTNLRSFPNLSQVTVYNVGEDDLPMLAQSPVADAVTHLEAAEYLRLVPRGRTGAGSAMLPNLVSLTVAYAHDRASLFPQTLRELTLESPLTHRTASLVTRLTSLTCLRINIRTMQKPFEAVTALTALQRLEICSHLSFAPFVAQLTRLTHLQFKADEDWRKAYWTPAWSISEALASVTRLHSLVHLGVGCIDSSLEHQFLASLETFTSLRSLELGLDHQPYPSASETVWVPPSSQLTALRLERGDLYASILPKFSLDRLQHLSLTDHVRVGQDGVAALKRATGLTELRVWIYGGTALSPEGVGIALSCMPRLRALSLHAWDEEHFCFHPIGLLTELTELECLGGHVSHADVKVCLGLRKLRLLTIRARIFSPAASDGVTLELLVAIAKLPELTKFRTTNEFWSDRLNLGEDIRARLDAERHEKGWPPAELVLLY